MSRTWSNTRLRTSCSEWTCGTKGVCALMNHTGGFFFKKQFTNLSMPEYLYILRLASAYSGMMTPMVENSAQVSDVDKSTHARFTVISQPQAQPSRAVTSPRDGRQNNLPHVCHTREAPPAAETNTLNYLKIRRTLR
jgi:hypothetical protein